MPWPLRPLIKLFMISNEEGAKTSLYCATSNEVEDLSGEYFDKCKVKKPSKLALDSDLAEKLWEKSEEFTAT
jgi:retinol dehydrogenase-12